MGILIADLYFPGEPITPIMDNFFEPVQYNYLPDTLYPLLISLILTIIIEVALGMLVFRVKDWKTLLLVQAITNPILFFVVSAVFSGTRLVINAFFVMEFLVIISEWLLYKKFLDYKKPFMLSLVLNGVTIIATIVLISIFAV